MDLRVKLTNPYLIGHRAFAAVVQSNGVLSAALGVVPFDGLCGAADER